MTSRFRFGHATHPDWRAAADLVLAQLSGTGDAARGDVTLGVVYATSAFSAATRNSLVVLPLALAVPGGVPLLPAIIVAQTMVELVSELAYIRLLPRLGRDVDRAAAPSATGTSSGEPPA